MKAFPVIRYRTGDFAAYVGKKCSCGRNYTLIKNLVGRRQEEQIITKKNSFISMTALNMHTDIFDNVKQFQFVQKEKGKVLLNIIKDQQYSKKDEHKIRKEFNEKFKDFVDMNIKYIDKIAFTKNGKYKYLIQEIKEIK